MTSKSTNGLVLRIVVELVAAAVLAFALAAFAAPMLMNIRSNLAFWTGVACWPLAGAVILVAAALAIRDIRTLRREREIKARLYGPQ
ncbi:hypothetical protein [Phenylobacterium montanum]|uniref:Uncharacterized protein n=1 Tax=Phenylobacterium montanum TaxID=2823693 RepID=A0A975G1J1_9CAUL|nr:hypothetical protein [Caulobacter sp. S6]QUD88853.1 hypothetical protein KCG34_02900 [Caulobacter sp. S6]